MQRPTRVLLTVLLLFTTATAAENDRVLPGDSEAIQVILPKGKLTISYVEAAEGMMVYVESRGLTVKARRVFIGDGQHAVRFEARHDGFYLPEGKRNVGSCEYEAGGAIKYLKENRQAWAEKSGEVYVLVPGVKLEETK